MILQKSQFVHRLLIGTNRVLLIHAVSHLRLAVDAEVAQVIDFFAQPRAWPEEYNSLAKIVPHDQETLSGFIRSLTERGILTEQAGASCGKVGRNLWPRPR